MEQFAKLLDKYHIKASPEVQEHLLTYINKMVLNICSLLSSLTLFYNPKTKKVTPEIIKHALTYVKEVCYPQLTSKKGGSYNIDSQYFGQETNAYTEAATNKNLAETIDFANNTARAQIGGCGCAGAVQMGGATYIITEFTELAMEEIEKDSFLGTDLIPIFQSFNVTISDNSLELVKQILKMHLNCFMYDLKQQKGKLTIKKVDEVAAMKAHVIFN
jgi:hypothetical protein